MARIMCLLCDQWISSWAMATDKTVTVNGHELHKSCVERATIKQIEVKLEALSSR